MTMTVALIVGLLLGGSIAFLGHALLRQFFRRRRRRDLASGLIGEIAAVLRALEVSGLEQGLSELAESPDDEHPEAFGIVLPSCAFYRANARRLVWLRSPLPREIAYFYARLSSLRIELRALVRQSGAPSSSRAGRAATDLRELRQLMELGDEVLRRLRPLVSTPRPSSVSRA